MAVQHVFRVTGVPVECTCGALMPENSLVVDLNVDESVETICLSCAQKPYFSEAECPGNSTTPSERTPS